MQMQNNQDNTNVENQIATFKQQLSQKSNQELSQVASQLESVEKAALEQKISNQLDTIQENITQPSDAGAATATQNKSSNNSSEKGQDANNATEKKLATSQE